MDVIRVVLGGTFNPPIHRGHKALLKRAFELACSCDGGEVAIGLTSDSMASGKKETCSFEERIYKLRQCINEDFEGEARIIEINDPYGVTLDEDFDYIVVSPETYEMAQKINEKRVEKGMTQIEIVKIDYVLCEKGKVISSTRIKKGEIDGDGKLL